jgi:hypothetical protein
MIADEEAQSVLLGTHLAQLRPDFPEAVVHGRDHGKCQAMLEQEKPEGDEKATSAWMRKVLRMVGRLR